MSITRITSTGGSGLTPASLNARNDSTLRGWLLSRILKSHGCSPVTAFPPLSATTTSNLIFPSGINRVLGFGGGRCVSTGSPVSGGCAGAAGLVWAAIDWLHPASLKRSPAASRPASLLLDLSKSPERISFSDRRACVPYAFGLTLEDGRP